MRRTLLIAFCLLMIAGLAPGEGRESAQLLVGIAALEKHDYPRAVRAFSQAVRENPHSAAAQRWLATACLRAGTGEAATDPEMVGRAVAAFKEALRLEPESAEARYHLGVAYLALNDKDAALKESQDLAGRDAALAAQLRARIDGWRSPASFRSAEGRGGEGTQTRVTVAGNTVLVPVTLTHNGATVEATLVLDTGASVTVISRELAQRLNFDLTRASGMQAQVADGSTVQAWQIRLDQVTVGPQTRNAVEAAVVQSRGAFPFDGLLGMNFLRSYKYSVDIRNQVINWHQ